ncbi:hypothetical protein EON63_10340 [archaeon]|nr:MAG: hypothetical protein EON63_10340 [archaeon]
MRVNSSPTPILIHMNPYQYPYPKVSALVGCAIFSFSDWLDGYLAKRLNQATTLGAFLDPIADKIMIASLAVGLVYKGLMPMELACVYLGMVLIIVIFHTPYTIWCRVW